MPKQVPPITAWSQYVGARLADMALQFFDVDVNLETAAAVGRVLHRVDRRHRERAWRHLRFAFPEKTDAEIDDLTLQSFEHFAKLLVEICHTPRLMNRDHWVNCAELGNLGRAAGLLNAGKPAILVTGHVGNWELLGTLMSVLGYRMHAVARPLDNPLINDWLLGIRQKRGLRVITKWQASDTMVDVLQGGGMLGFIADQNAGHRGMFVPFFGRLASTYKSIGILAMRQRVPIICGHAWRLGKGYHYRLGVTDIIKPEDWEAHPNPLYYVTARYMRAIENMIRQTPAQYLWMHRRWKSRPRYERQGKPMPGRMRENLASLPWLDEAAIEELCKPLPPELQKR